MGEPSPLAAMDAGERLSADYRGTGLTIGRHPMALRREEMKARGVTAADHLGRLRHGAFVRIAGAVIVRQRPGTANGFVFLSVEDETGISNVIVQPAVFDRHKFEVLAEPFVVIDGILQSVDGTLSVKAGRVAALAAPSDAPPSHDFH